jgi:hypothetical protein
MDFQGRSRARHLEEEASVVQSKSRSDYRVGFRRYKGKLVAAEGISADFVKEGECLAEALSTAEGAQEKECKALPKEVEERAFQKGSLRHPERAK